MGPNGLAHSPKELSHHTSLVNSLAIMDGTQLDCRPILSPSRGTESLNSSTHDGPCLVPWDVLYPKSCKSMRVFSSVKTCGSKLDLKSSKRVASTTLETKT